MRCIELGFVSADPLICLPSCLLRGSSPSLPLCELANLASHCKVCSFATRSLARQTLFIWRTVYFEMKMRDTRVSIAEKKRLIETRSLDIVGHITKFRARTFTNIHLRIHIQTRRKQSCRIFQHHIIQPRTDHLRFCACALYRHPAIGSLSVVKRQRYKPASKLASKRTNYDVEKIDDHDIYKTQRLPEIWTCISYI